MVGNRACMERSLFLRIRGRRLEQTHGWPLKTWYLAIVLMISRGRKKEGKMGRNSRQREWGNGPVKLVDMGNFK